VLARTLVTGVIGGSVSALMPRLVARDLLHGGAQNIRHHARCIRHGRGDRRLNIAERAQANGAARPPCALARCRWQAPIAAVALSTGAGTSRSRLVVAGAVWNAGRGIVQTSGPALGAALGRGPLAGGIPGSIAGGIAYRKLGLGTSDRCGRGGKNAVAGFCRPDVRFALLGLWLRMPPVGAATKTRRSLPTAEVRLSLTGRSEAAGGRDRIPRAQQAPAASTT